MIHPTDTTAAPSTRMTALDHYEIADEVRRGDLRRIGQSFADHSERTKKARGEVRHVINLREAPMVWQSPEIRRRDRERAGLKVSPVKHVIYLEKKALDSIAQIKIDARAKWEAQRIAAVSAVLLPAYESCGYRRSQSSWAGGEHTVNVRIASKTICGYAQPVGASGDSSRAWSANGKWSGNNSVHTLTVKRTWVDLPEAARVVAGMLTLDLGAEIEPNIYLAAWVEQGRGFTLNTVHGYLVKTDDGWKHSDSMTGARRLLTVSTQAKPAVDLLTMDAAAMLKRARLTGHEHVTIETAHEAGNCYAGIRDWCAKHGIDTAIRTTVTTQEIATLAASTKDRVREVYAVLLQAAKVKRASRASEVSAAA